VRSDASLTLIFRRNYCCYNEGSVWLRENGFDNTEQMMLHYPSIYFFAENTTHIMRSNERNDYVER
jgi:hypothetical protein